MPRETSQASSSKEIDVFPAPDNPKTIMKSRNFLHSYSESETWDQFLIITWAFFRPQKKIELFLRILKKLKDHLSSLNKSFIIKKENIILADWKNLIILSFFFKSLLLPSQQRKKFFLKRQPVSIVLTTDTCATKKKAITMYREK